MDSFTIKNLTIPHKLILAPMCGITNLPFRLICKKYQAGLVFNQMVSAKALIMKDKKSMGMLTFQESERPIAMQVFGNDEKVLSEAAKIIEQTGCDLIDLNLGCPARKIVNDGGGSALLNDIDKLSSILKAMRKSLTIPFTIKIRAGWDSESIKAPEVAKLAENEGIDAVTIHARTRAQGYKGQANWGLIKEIKEGVSIPVIGNGDVKQASDAHRMMAQTGCDAVMTGRAAFHQPWIFQDFIHNTDTMLSHNDLLAMLLQHYDYARDFFGDSRGLKIMRKFICSYTKGIRGGSAFRNEILRLDDWETIKEKLPVFFNALK
ncbi:MAG: tRNA dihydrouridine synthase DusB [bacterium]|nr:tRNA dihydrouridine synthase DusB [bacterium]MBU1917731.1 tRNA dihydrouridine synthase DusB [bacterium]